MGKIGEESTCVLLVHGKVLCRRRLFNQAFTNASIHTSLGIGFQLRLYEHNAIVDDGYSTIQTAAPTNKLLRRLLGKSRSRFAKATLEQPSPTSMIPCQPCCLQCLEFFSQAYELR